MFQMLVALTNTSWCVNERTGDDAPLCCSVGKNITSKNPPPVLKSCAGDGKFSVAKENHEKPNCVMFSHPSSLRNART
jgi:hypothetical protein